MWLKSERPSDPITASVLSRALDKEKTSFSIFLLSSKLTIFPFLFSKHDTNDIADTSSIQDACHIRTSWWPYLLYSLFDSVVEHWKVESEGLRLLSHTHDKMKKHLSLFPDWAQNLPTFLSYLLFFCSCLFGIISFRVIFNQNTTDARKLLSVGKIVLMQCFFGMTPQMECCSTILDSFPSL